MHIFLLSIRTCPKTSQHSLHPESRSGSLLSITRQTNYHSQTEKEETKGSAHCANKTFSPVRCCSIHKGHYLQLQLNRNYMYTSYNTPLSRFPFPQFISTHIKHVTSPFTLTLCAANNSTPLFTVISFEQLHTEEQKAALLCSHLAHAGCAVPCAEEEGSAGHIDATSPLPHAPVTSSYVCIYLSLPSPASKQKN